MLVFSPEKNYIGTMCKCITMLEDIVVEGLDECLALLILIREDDNFLQKANGCLQNEYKIGGIL